MPNTKAFQSNHFCHFTMRHPVYVTTYYLNIIFFDSEVVLGEHRVDTDPDCSGDGKCSPPKITRGIKEIITHEGYDSENNYKHDIALIRLDQEVTLNSEDAGNSAVMPVCLPWAKDSTYR